MRPPRFFQRSNRRLIPALVLVLVLLTSLTQQAHAANFVGYNAANVQTQTACTGVGAVGGCFTCGADGNDGSKCGTGDALQSPLTGTIISVTFTVGDTLPNQVVITTFPVGQTPATTLTGPPCNGQGGPCLTVNAGQSFTVQDVEGLSGLTAFTAFVIGLANPVSVTLNQFVSVQLMRTSGGAASPHGLVSLCSANCASVTGAFDSCIDFGTTAPVTGTAYTETALGNCGPGINIATGATFSSTATTGQTLTVTQCYGNCGSPAITLVNTNSTHLTNFNQSITLMYEFQSNINGFLLNVTTSTAKSYSTIPTVLSIGAYTIANCPAGKIQFTNDCPALLQSSASIPSPGKGRQALILGNGAVGIQNGQWVGITVTATFSGMDLNDTNTLVQLFQVNGQNPPSITAATSLGTSKLGLWAWIRGNTVSGIQPTTGVQSCQSFATIDCWMPALVNGFCSNTGPQCQTSSALFWILFLSVIFELVIAMSFNRIAPNLKVPFGEMFIFILLMLTFIMTGLQLLFLWVPVFLFMIGMVVFSKHTGRYF